MYNKNNNFLRQSEKEYFKLIMLNTKNIIKIFDFFILFLIMNNIF